MRALKIVPALLLLAVGLSACAYTPKKFDYTAFRAHQPRSVLVLPPVNESPDLKGTYGYLSAEAIPLAEKGYYVFPVELVDRYMKQNGLPEPEDMNRVPLKKLREVFGADAVLYTKLTDYGTDYQLLNSSVKISAEARLVDTRTGIEIWHNKKQLSWNSSAGSVLGGPIATLAANLISAAVGQVVNSSHDAAHRYALNFNYQLYADRLNGLLDGPYIKDKK